MEPASPPPVRQTPDPLLERLVARARALSRFEAAWPLVVLAACVAGVLVLLALSDIGQALPGLIRFAILAAALVAVVGLVVTALRQRGPARTESLTRIDAASGDPALPATTLDDEAVNGNDPMTQALWQAHRERLRPRLQSINLGSPDPDMARRDPFALRALLLLLLVPTVIAAGSQFAPRLLAFADPSSTALPPAWRVDLWVTPPAYTGRAPLMLARKTDGPVSVPQGSLLSLRASGVTTLGVETGGGAVETTKEGEGTREWRLDSDATMAFAPKGENVERHAFSVIADTPPRIILDGDPTADERLALQFRYSVEDDYGVTELDARFKPAGSLAARDLSRALVPPPDFRVSLPQARMKSGKASATRDLVSHPWAGLPVELTLAGRDDAGHLAVSAPVTTVLPARTFVHPLAMVLADQRRDLALDAGAKARLMRVFEAWMLAPEALQTPPREYLIVSTLAQRLQRAETAPALREFLDTLWAYALALEEGRPFDAERDVQAAFDALREAIERGASPEEIKRLTDKLQEAMNRLTQELAQKALRDGKTQQQARKPPPGTRTIKPQDFKKLSDEIARLLREGKQAEAERLMRELQQMMRDMEAARQNGQLFVDDSGDGKDDSEKLSDIIRKQQQLRDQTFRRGQNDRQQKSRRPGQQGQNQQGKPGEQPPEASELGEKQQDLADQFDQLSRDMGQDGEEGEEEGQGQQQRPGNGPTGMQGQQGMQGQGQGQGEGEGENLEAEARRGFGQARRAMRDARDALKRGDAQSATDAQGRAIRGMQRGAQALAQQQQGEQGQQGQAQAGRGQRNGGETDPLGRPVRRRGPMDDGTTEVPGAAAAARAQQLLDELRRRAGELARPPLELDYIDRLLRGVTPQ